MTKCYFPPLGMIVLPVNEPAPANELSAGERVVADRGAIRDQQDAPRENQGIYTISTSAKKGINCLHKR